MKAPFQAGDKVLCTDDNLPRQTIEYFVRLPVAGEVYTVAHVQHAICVTTATPMWSLTLKEAPAINDGSGSFAGFSYWRFVKLTPEQVAARELMERKPKTRALEMA